jgi:uncharacterized protein
MPDTLATTGRSWKTAPQEPLPAKDGVLRRAIATVVAILLGVTVESFQTPPIRAVAASLLREYTGVYEWAPDSFVYLQMWEELTGFGKPALVAFDQSGWVRLLYPVDQDRFFAGPAAAVSTAVESRIAFQRDRAGAIVSLSWQRGDGEARIARRVDVETHEDVAFANRDIRLAGTLISPKRPGKHPAIILVHGSGPENREFILPLARFLIRRGIAVFGYDKRGVGGSTGDWQTASFEDLAGDVVAAFKYLRSRRDIDAKQIGLLGISQAGWIMPIAAVNAPDIAFVISVSGAGVPADETALDHARNEMTASGMRPETVEQILNLTRLQYRFARTGDGWDDYLAARDQLAKRLGTPPPNYPGTTDDPLWRTMRAFYFFDPGPILRRLKTPTLAIFGELDNNILAEKNKAAWEAALRVAGNRDYLLTIIPAANHGQWQAKVGNDAEEPTLQGFTPAYFATVAEWLARRLRESFGRR